MATASTLFGSAPSSAEPLVRITDVRISQFRSLNNVEVSLADLTLLIGANNAGKTSLLDALYLAIGSGRKSLSGDDMRLAPGETIPAKNRKVTIDIRLRLFDLTGNPLDSFPAGGFWTSLWGTGIVQDPLDDFREFAAIRTTVEWNPAKADFVLKRDFLKEWLPFADWLKASTDKSVAVDMIEPIAMHYIDAKRDLEEDLKRQGSFWRRMVDDLGLTEAEVASIEGSLSALNEQIVAGSSVLKHVKSHLADLEKVVSADSSGIELSPISRRLRDMAKGIDVGLTTIGGQTFPLARHGMGTRSLASLMVFRAYASWKAMQASAAGNHVHTVLALEEPEAHLHPQAQRSLFSQVKRIPGQRVVSTHSPYFAGQAHLSSLRLFRKEGGETRISQLDLSKITPDDLRKLQSVVVHTRGDLLFARGLVFFEGQTEEQSLPVWAERYWGSSIHELGFSFICVGGTDYHPFLWLSESLGIPWYIISDGEPQPLNQLGKALKRLGYSDVTSCPNVFVFPNGNNFERQLLAEGYGHEIEQALDDANCRLAFLDSFIEDLHGTVGKDKVVRDYKGAGGRERAALEAMRLNKTRLAYPLAQRICQLPLLARRFPVQINDLLSLMSQTHGIPKAAQ